MNIIHKLASVGAIVLVALTTTANAASIDATSSAATVDVGNTFDITLTGDFGVDGFGGGGLDALWSDPLLDLVSIVLAPLPGLDAGFSCPGGGLCPADTASTARVAWGTFSGNLIPGGAAPTLMATLTFQAVAAGTANIDMADAGLSWLNAAATGLIPIPSFNGTSVTINSSVVPVPAAVWLFGSGLLGLVGVARRRKAA